MTITISQLDELERNARGELDDGNSSSVPVDAAVVLQLVAIARAALAWSSASRACAKLRAEWSRTGDDAKLVGIGRLDACINESRQDLERLLGVAP